MAAEVRWLCFVALIAFDICLVLASAPFKRFEYKYSFKPPYLAQKDGTVPFWEYGGNAIASAENVRIAPSLRSQKGAIWTKAKTNFDWWEVDVLFRVTGRGRIGADGLAFWYTETKGAYDGPVFGSSDKWVGLGIFFDSFDNDNKHNNPYIMAIVNDGTKEFDHQNDGTTQLLAGCLRDFRNKPFPTRARIEYYMNTLTVLFHSGMTNNEQDMEVCLRVDNVVLPKTGHFGLSAATGGLADDHDVLHFLTSSLHPPGQAPTAAPAAPRVSEEEQRKLSQEYADYQRKLDMQKEEYRREHPEAAGRPQDPDADPDVWFESDSQRELRQIFTGQSQMFESLRELSRKLDEVVGRQERALSLLGQLGTGGPAPQQLGGAPGQVQVGDTIRRHEVDAILNNQNTILSTARELRTFIMEVHSRADAILQAQGKGTGQGAGAAFDLHTLAGELRDGLNALKRDAAAQRTGGPPAGGCPDPPSCVPPTVFLIAVVVQLVIILGYSMYRDSREAQAKKFY
ncbi:hypothetical protein R5R35_009505 [Gryllus longicercus]|uniref:L-type lectin-like domain-containing protein n=1 Tax=Gryllus longicercus TaxID=2509291 RepID=A0AAN9V0Z2_9ORTH